MKVSITDQFLWDLYNTVEKVGDVVLPARRGPRGINSQYSFYAQRKKALGRREFSKLVYRLKRAGLVRVKELEGKSALLLTQKGKDRAMRAKFKTEVIKRQKRNDGKWLMIIFDIPKNRNRSRNLLRSILENLGYKMYQQSVWVTPYDVSEKTEKLLQWYNLEKFVRIFLIESL